MSLTHFDRMQAIISQLRDIAQRLDINVLMILYR